MAKDKDKSIIEKFTDTVKELADSATQALKSDDPKRAAQTTAVYMPFAAEGMVSDPLIVAPVVVQPARKRRTARKAARRGAGKRAAGAPAKKSARKGATKSTRKTARKTARKSIRTSQAARSKSATARTVRKTSRTTAKRGRASKAKRNRR
jgi:hypothetical protein